MKITAVITTLIVAAALLVPSLCQDIDTVRCVMERSQLLQISHGALRDNTNLRQQVTGLRGEVVDMSEQLIALGKEHSGVLREYSALMEGQKELLAYVLTLEEEHASLKAKYMKVIEEMEEMSGYYKSELEKRLLEQENALGESEEKYFRLLKEVDIVFGQMEDLRQDQMKTSEEKQEITEFFENYIDALLESQKTVLREKEEQFLKIYQEKEEADYKLKNAEETEQGLLLEIKKVKENFEKESRV